MFYSSATPVFITLLIIIIRDVRVTFKNQSFLFNTLKIDKKKLICIVCIYILLFKEYYLLSTAS